MNLIVYGADAIDAYAHSPEPDAKAYLSVDDAYEEWWNSTAKERDKPPITRKFVLPIRHCLQGCPTSGVQWMRFIDDIIINQMGFRTTTHDRCIYYKIMEDGEPVYMLRQVDDFLLACRKEKTAKDIFHTIGVKMQFDTEREQNIVPIEFLGVVNDYNGVEIKQTPYYIEMSCKNYIKRLLRSHSWESTEDKETSSLVDPSIAAVAALHLLETAIENEDYLKDNAKFQPSTSKLLEAIKNDPLNISNRSIPMSTDCIERIYKESGPKEGTAHHKALEDSVGFSYRTLLGELMYAMITCRPDIGYAVTTLSKFSTSPSAYHYKLLQSVSQYLKSTIDWGICFKQPSPMIIEESQYEENQEKGGFLRATSYSIPNDLTLT